MILIRVSQRQPNPGQGMLEHTAKSASCSPADNKPLFHMTAKLWTQGSQWPEYCLVVPKYTKIWGSKALHGMHIFRNLPSDIEATVDF